jgi:NDP-sugar pyrophosphorylase family protein
VDPPVRLRAHRRTRRGRGEDHDRTDGEPPGAVAVGDDCRVSEGATIRQSVLLPGSSVGSGAYLEDCVVGPGYEIRAGE